MHLAYLKWDIPLLNGEQRRNAMVPLLALCRNISSGSCLYASTSEVVCNLVSRFRYVRNLVETLHLSFLKMCLVHGHGKNSLAFTALIFPTSEQLIPGGGTGLTRSY